MYARDARSFACLALLGVAAWCALLGPRAAAAQSGGEARPRVLFLMPELRPDVRAQLREALLAQLALIDAELVLRDEDDPNASDGGALGERIERIERARALAVASGANVAVWLDAQPSGAWLVHILDVGQERMVVRRIDGRPQHQAAAVEAVAVLAREASRVSPRGSPAAADGDDAAAAQPPADVPPPSPAPSVPGTEPRVDAPAEADAPAPPHAPRLALFYSGVDFAPQTAFSHAVSLGGRLDLAKGIFLGLHAGWAALATPPGPLVLQRIPLGGFAGYRIRLFDRGWADLEFGLVVELLARSTRGAPTGQMAAPDSLRVAAALAPRLRFEYKPLELLGFFAGFGLDAALTTVPYEAGGAPREVLVSPNWIRPALEAGAAFYP